VAGIAVALATTAGSVGVAGGCSKTVAVEMAMVDGMVGGADAHPVIQESVISVSSSVRIAIRIKAKGGFWQFAL